MEDKYRLLEKSSVDFLDDNCYLRSNVNHLFIFNDRSGWSSYEYIQLGYIYF